MDDLREAVEKSSRAMIFYNEGMDEYPYSLFGSSFLCQRCGEIYLVTAGHVMSGRSGAEVQVHAREDYSDSSLPIDTLASIPPQKQLSSHALDFVVMHVARELCSDEQVRLAGRLNLDVLQASAPTAGTRLLVTGYPSALRSIDYEARKFSHRRVIVDAEYDEPGGDGNTHFMTIRPIAAIETLDGFSGSPVFTGAWKGDQFSPSGFEGVVIRATQRAKKPNTVQYISGAMVLETLDKLSKS